jgi:flavodoxin
MKALVAYFSAQGTTAALAKELAKKANADLLEICPQIPYTDADIKWTNPLARCNREKIGKKDVPVAGEVAGWAEYDLVYLGFPIWYYGAPNVVNTFCKGYDWQGKRVALFATSGGSGIGRTVEKLRPYVAGGEIVKAEVIRGGKTLDDILL